MIVTPAYAQAAGAGANSLGAMISTFAPFVLILVVFYFLMLRPQQQRAKAHQAAINGLKKGDSVVTAGGVAGKVTKIEERFVEVEIAPTVKVRVVKSTLVEVSGSGAAKPAND